MFKHNKIFSSFSVNDIEKAKKFYGDTLGLQAEMEEMGMLSLHLSNETQIMVYPKPNHQPATYTVLNFMVDNIEKTVNELTQKGVKFEHYEGEIKTDEHGIAHGKDVGRGPNIAWFTDPAGNILAVIEK